MTRVVGHIRSDPIAYRTPVPLQRWNFTTLSPFLRRPFPSQFLHACFFFMFGPFSLFIVFSRDKATVSLNVVRMCYRRPTIEQRPAVEAQGSADTVMRALLACVEGIAIIPQMQRDDRAGRRCEEPFASIVQVKHVLLAEH